MSGGLFSTVQVAELTREWAAKWKDIQRIVEVYVVPFTGTVLLTHSPLSLVLQEHHLALRSEGIKMIVDSQRPHFVGVDPDVLSTGLVFYYLKVNPLVK